MHWIILLFCNTLEPSCKYFISSMQYPMNTLTIYYPTQLTYAYPHQGNANALDYFVVMQ
jgi:hypothetical protein